jgi:hypothetical protein
MLPAADAALAALPAAEAAELLLLQLFLPWQLFLLATLALLCAALVLAAEVANAEPLIINAAAAVAATSALFNFIIIAPLNL